MKPAEAKAIIRLCWPMLKEQYNHTKLVIKLQELGFETKAPNLTNIKKALIEEKTDRVIALGPEFLEGHALAFISVIESWGKLAYDKEKKAFVKLEGAEDSAAEEEGNPESKQTHGIIIYEEGRRSTSEKRKFIKNAQQEIIEVGVRLHTFSQYFTSRRKSEFRGPIENLLKKGVTIKCLMMDPASPMTKLYMTDRAKALPSENKAFDKMEEILEELKMTRDELNGLQYKGKFELLTYENFPYNHYMMVDPELDSGRILVSSYIHGIRRADCPVMEIRKSTAKITFDKYYKSLKLILEQAKPV